MNKSMQMSYQAHPAFQFEQPSWDLDTQAFDAFNRLYETAKACGDRLNQASQAELLRNAQLALEKIFAHFESQCSDEYELTFVKELQGQCLRLLGEEFAWYSSRAKSEFVSLADSNQECHVHSLFKDQHYFGQLPDSEVAAIHQLAEPHLKQFKQNAEAGKLTREDLSINSGPTVRAIRKILNKAFAKNGALAAMNAYTGRRIKVSGLALELSVPQSTWWRNAIEGMEQTPKTLYAHLDETISCPKAIVYLSNVTESNGPTSCYPQAYQKLNLNPLQEIIGRVIGTVGNAPNSILKPYYQKQYHQSVNSENFRRHFMRLPPCLRFNSHLGWDVMPGSDFESELVSLEHTMLGPAGTFIVFDGARLLHRGGLIQSGERIALQVILSDLTFTQRLISKFKKVFA